MTNESRSLGSTCVKEFLLHRSLLFFVPTITPHTLPLQMSDFLLVKKGEKSGKFAATSPAATSEPRIIGVEHIPYGHEEQTFSSRPLIRARNCSVVHGRKKHGAPCRILSLMFPCAFVLKSFLFLVSTSRQVS